MRPRIVISAALLSTLAAAPLVAQAAQPNATTKLANTAIPNLSRAADLGAVPARTKLEVVVGLANPNASAERAAFQAIYDKQSASYHHYMTPQQWATNFAVPSSTYDRIAKWLTRSGMSVGYSSPTHDLVALTGTAAAAARTFSVTLHNYSYAGHTFRANTSAATVPVGVTALRGLQTLSAYQLPKHPVASAPAQDGPCIQGVCTGSVTPQDLWSVYQQPSNDRGSGVSVGIIGEGDTTTTIKALRNFEHDNNLPAVNVTSYFVADDRSDDSGKGEWQIDSQAIQGMAPDIAGLNFYMSQDLTTTDAALSYWANQSSAGTPTIANMSIGGCEAVNVALGGASITQSILQQLASEGRTLFVATGDTGGSCAVAPVNGVENTGVPSAQWPASSDAVLAVGGTVLYTDGGTPAQRQQEITWTHSGGGTSFFVPEPSWQQGVSVVQGRCVADLNGNPVSGGTICRGVPDVSSLSGDVITNGYASVDEANAPTFGAGTSLSSPLWAGMWARVQAASVSTSTDANGNPVTALKPLGFAAPLIYANGLDATKDANDFFDISTGSNVQWQAIPRNQADPSGWDYTNGFGVPQLTGLVKDVDALTGEPTAPLANPAPAPDQVVVADGGGGGGTGCGPNGVVTDPTGDDWLGAGVNTDDTDLTEVDATYDATNNAVTWTAHLVGLGSNPEAKTFEFDFSYNNEISLDFNTSRDVLGDISTEIDTVDSTGSLTSVPIPGIKAVWDDAASTVSVTLPVDGFNSTVTPTTPLGPGGSLSKLDYFADRTTAQSQRPANIALFIPADEATTTCDFVLQ